MQLTWRRSPSTSNYVATDTSVEPNQVYSVGRNTSARQRGQWYLETWPADNVEQVQRRYGFSGLRIAKLGALSTHCFRCGRSVPFGSLEVDKAAGSFTTWKCRDTGPCDTEAARIRHIELDALVRQPYNVIEVRDTQYGPELVFGHEWMAGDKLQGNRTVIGGTEADLLKLEAVLRDRREARNRASAAETVARLRSSDDVPFDVDLSPADPGPAWVWPEGDVRS